MLEKLDSIDWSKLGHAYGPATDVPNLLRQLASPEEDERQEAISELYGNIWHQGTVYEATAHAVPFLVELLEADVADKQDILILLAHLANGSSYHDVHQHLPILKDEAAKSDWQERIPVELVWVRAANAAVKSAEPTYLKLLSSPEPSVREAAVYLLASLDKPVPELARQIWERFEKERDERVKASFLIGFGALAETSDLNQCLLLHVLSTESARGPRLAAAMSLIRIAPEHVPKEVAETLLDAIRNPSRYDGLKESPWVAVDGMEMLISNHLARLEGEAAAAVEQALAESLPSEDHPQALATAEALLAVAFRKTIPSDAAFASLTERQQRVLRLIARCPKLWVQTVGGDRAQSVKTSLLMRCCGLPDKLQEFLVFVTDEAGTFANASSSNKKSGVIGSLKKLFDGRSSSSSS